MKLKMQLAAASAVSIVFSIVIISISSFVFINREFREYRVQLQAREAHEHALHLQSQYNHYSGGWNTEYVHGFGMYALNEGYIIKLRDAAGNMVWDAENHDMTHCHEIMSAIRQKMQSVRESGEGDIVTRTFPLTAHGQSIGTAEISYYAPYYFRENEFRFVDSLNIILAGAGIITLLLAITLAIIISRRISAPIERTIAAAEQISRGSYCLQLDQASPIEETRNLCRSMEQMARLLENREDLQQRLISDVAHELRTPVANVSAQLEAMSEGVTPPTPERLALCYEELGRLTGLIHDLQSLQALEQDVDHSRFEQVSCHLLWQHLLAVFEPEIHKKGLQCTVTGPDTPVTGEKKRLLQLFSNLLSNSIKYTPEHGSVTITIEDHERVQQIDVSDTGIGIPQEDIPFIFERFYRTDKSRTRKTGGAGIGLTIARAIARSHGGDITVSSPPGSGTTFTVTLPLPLLAS